MTTATSASSRRKTSYYFTVGTNQVVELKLKKSSFNAALLTEMGAEGAYLRDVGGVF
ncbi:MAG: hypothetical protein ACFB0D_02070 [Phormidesmis sp.]